MSYIVKKVTDKEQLALYMSLPKKQLAEMLLECNKALTRFYKEQKPLVSKDTE